MSEVGQMRSGAGLQKTKSGREARQFEGLSRGITCDDFWGCAGGGAYPRREFVTLVTSKNLVAALLLHGD